MGLSFSCLLALALLLPSLAMAQQSQKGGGSKGVIEGTVTDQTQAVVIGAKVQLSNAAGVKQETASDEKGSYHFRGLDPGTYTLTVTAPNFPTKALDTHALTPGPQPT